MAWCYTILPVNICLYGRLHGLELACQDGGELAELPLKKKSLASGMKVHTQMYAEMHAKGRM
jgi:hypothetical protein